MAYLLIFAPELQYHRHARGESRDLGVGGIFEPADLPVEGSLVSGGETLATVRPGYADPGKAAVEQLPLEPPTVLDVGQLVLVGTSDGLVATDAALGARHVLRQPDPGSRREVPDALDITGVVHGEASRARMSVSRAACCPGVPKSGVLVATRRRNR